ncbi:hypothetical protein INT47_002111, partial [Mucor saturninus]
IKTWWRQLKTPSISNKSTGSATSSHTTLDWRSLSPDRPPLPFFLPDNSPTSSTTSIHNNNNNDTSTTTNSTHNASNITSKTTKNTLNNIDNLDKPNRTNTDDRNHQSLCPILEESETMITESTESNMMLSRLSPSSLQEEEEPSQRQLEKQPMSISRSSEEDESLPDIKSIQKTPSDRYMSDNLVGDEERCKRKFAKMVLAANKFQTKQQREEKPSHMELVFDVHGNIDMMCMVRQGKSEYHKFCGNSQYVPPELSVQTEYHSELADIWVLGVFLYRMLVGKYPFSAANDQQLFKKMLHGNFSIPSELSEDAKDLLRRMLAPDLTRASLDLIIYHPWIKSYRPLLLDKCQQPSSNHHQQEQLPPAPQQQQNTRRKKPSKSTSTSKKLLKRAFSLLVQGPFPPPKQPYKDLSHLGTRETVFARQRV